MRRRRASRAEVTHSGQATVAARGTPRSLTGGNRPSKLPSSADERVDIRDLTWDDRERVLRLLFARINNSEPFQAMPPHPLQSADLDAARRQAALDAAAEDDGGQYGGGGGFFPTQPEVA